MDLQDIPVSVTSDLEKRVADAFLIFDHHGNKSVDVREVGTIIRFLGCAPTESEINEIISATEFEDSSGTIHLSKFLPHVCQLVVQRKMEPASPEKLLEAFQVLDSEDKGFLSKEYIEKIMMEEGEPFTQEELDEMLAVAVDPQTGNIPYEFYLNQLMLLAPDSHPFKFLFPKHEPENTIYDLNVEYEAIKKANVSHPRRMSEVMKELSYL